MITTNDWLPFFQSCQTHFVIQELREDQAESSDQFDRPTGKGASSRI